MSTHFPTGSMDVAELTAPEFTYELEWNTSPSFDADRGTDWAHHSGPPSCSVRHTQPYRRTAVTSSDVQKRTARAREPAYALLMGSPQISAPSCPHCRGTTLRNTRPSRSGCFRICSGCNHMWHVTGEALRAEKAPLRSRSRVAIPSR